jgi:alpha-ribazole phosphatase
LASLFLVRHGNTVWSGTGRYQGFSDVALNEDGLNQAEKLGQRLAGEKLRAVYSSDLQRAYHTAKVIAALHNLEVITTPDLRELNFGRCEGLTFQQIMDMDPEIIKIWHGRDFTRSFPDGESMQDLATRVRRFIGRLGKWGQGDNVLIVGHNGSLAVMICLLLGIGIEHWWQFKTSTACLSIVETYEDGAVLKLLNDLHHLCRY